MSEQANEACNMTGARPESAGDVKTRLELDIALGPNYLLRNPTLSIISYLYVSVITTPTLGRRALKLREPTALRTPAT